ncbi:hypothetical protein BXT86_02355 [candidate division WOR-3 bacterium 4484_100]|uniref:CheW-like domain-containing protein n=1 Tax=candidate division WOR-3 bacterium 4484_100 TaxID=1936077 RepID=A0A1V4QFS6_UNCW3|nr:MAG: hypothetical protein BXT86_02355 [candidate division WOR-3 bacterium 4484_100]
MDTIIVFRIGDEHIGIDINKVREVTESTEPVAVPGTPNFLLGLVNVRGEIIPVVSLKKRLGLKGEEQGNVLLIIEEKGRLAGLKVDELFGTKKIKEKEINRRSEFLSTKKEKQFFYGVCETGEKPILILDLVRTLSKEDK